MAIRINKIDKGDIVKINEDSPNATSYYSLWYKEFPVLEIDEKRKYAILDNCGEHCMISFDDLKFLKEGDIPKADKGMLTTDRVKEIDILKDRLNEQLKPLLTLKKKLYSNVDIESPISNEEKELNSQISKIFSDINNLVIEKRKLLK